MSRRSREPDFRAEARRLDRSDEVHAVTVAVAIKSRTENRRFTVLGLEPPADRLAPRRPRLPIIPGRATRLANGRNALVAATQRKHPRHRRPQDGGYLVPDVETEIEDPHQLCLATARQRPLSDARRPMDVGGQPV